MVVADHETMANAIRSRFDVLVAKVETPDLPTEYDNVKIVHPRDAIWARVNLKIANSDQKQVGNPVLFRTLGMLVVQLFAPFDTGPNALDVLARKVTVAFRAVTADGVTYRTPTVIPVGRSKEWWQVNVNCPFMADTLV